MDDRRFAVFAAIELALGLVGILLAWLFLQRFIMADLLSIEAFFSAIIGMLVGLLMATIIWLMTNFLSFMRDTKALKAVRFVRHFSWQQILILSLAAGFAEEMLFRGFLQPLWGILISSIIFAALHAVSKLYIAVAFLMSVIMGLLYTWTGNLAAPVVAHFVYDFSIMALLKMGYFDFAFKGMDFSQPVQPREEEAATEDNQEL